MIIVKLINVLLLCNFVYGTELVQIDVGNSINFNSVLKMQSTEKVDISNHGTHMALALESELKKINSKPLVAKQIFWDMRSGNRDSLAFAMRKAFEETPKVLSLSYGGKSKDFVEEAFMAAFAAMDTVIVAAAGNDGGGKTYFPANYENPCILSVGTKINSRKTSYSNDANSWLDYQYADPSGTSASTARMAARVVQIRRKNPSMSCDKVVLTMKMLYGKIKK